MWVWSLVLPLFFLAGDFSLPPSRQNCTVPEPVSFLTPCRCDLDCALFSDCCHLQRQQPPPPTTFSCVPVSSLSAGDSSERSVWLFNRCPPTWPPSGESIRRRCEDPPTSKATGRRPGLDLTVPVTAGRRLYKNLYCALCHGEDFTEPQVRLRCPQAMWQLQPVQLNIKNDEDPRVTQTTTLSTPSSNDNDGSEDDKGLSREEVERGDYDKCSLIPNITFSEYPACGDFSAVVSDCPDLPMNQSRLPDDRTALFPAPFNESVSWSVVRQRCLTAPTHFVECVNASRTAYRNPYCAICRSSTPCKPNNMMIIIVDPVKGVPGGIRYYRYDITLDFKRLAQREMQSMIRGGDAPRYFEINSIDDNSSTFNDTRVTFNNTDLRPDSLIDRVAGGLGLACSLLSILALLLLLAVYAAMPTLRNLGGLLTMSLGVSLLLALLCFLLGPLMAAWDAACRTLACLTYMAYISSFTWTSVFAVDLVRTFSSATGAAQGGEMEAGSKWRRYARVSVAGWLLPLALTVAALVVDVTVDEEWAGRPHFGEDQRCFFGSSIGLLAWFYSPVALAVGVNCVLTAVLFYSLWRTTAQTKGVKLRGEGRGRSMTLLCLKVTLIFGVTWVLGLAAAWTEVKAVRVVAGVITSLQGVWVSLAFVATPRVWRRVRKASRSTISRSSTIRRTSWTRRSSAGRRSGKMSD